MCPDPIFSLAKDDRIMARQQRPAPFSAACEAEVLQAHGFNHRLLHWVAVQQAVCVPPLHSNYLIPTSVDVARRSGRTC